MESESDKVIQAIEGKQFILSISFLVCIFIKTLLIFVLVQNHLAISKNLQSAKLAFANKKRKKRSFRPEMSQYHLKVANFEEFLVPVSKACLRKRSVF